MKCDSYPTANVVTRRETIPHEDSTTGSQRQSDSSKRFDDIAEAVKRIQEDMNNNRECINPLRTFQECSTLFFC